jgi:hypothetical protein
MTHRYDLIDTPAKVKKATGFLGDYCVYDKVKKVAYPASPSNMVCFMNGGVLSGIAVEVSLA